MRPNRFMKPGINSKIYTPYPLPRTPIGFFVIEVVIGRKSSSGYELSELSLNPLESATS